MGDVYFVRFGMMRHVARFAAGSGGRFAAGDQVVVGSWRGAELGQVLALTTDPDDPKLPPLRRAGPEDLEAAERGEADRGRRLSACEAVFRDGLWPLELIDVEPMLDDRRTVVLYLGPHRLDASGLAQAVRDSCGLDIVLQPVGRDEPAEDESHGGCGSCGEGGGCGSTGGGCGSEGGSGCGSCAVKDLVRHASVPAGDH